MKEKKKPSKNAREEKVEEEVPVATKEPIGKPKKAKGKKGKRNGDSDSDEDIKKTTVKAVIDSEEESKAKPSKPAAEAPKMYLHFLLFTKYDH